MKVAWKNVKIFIVLITCILHDETLAANGSYRVYSRSEAKYERVNYTSPNVLEKEPFTLEDRFGSSPPDSYDDLWEASTAEECARECGHYERPKICYYRWTVEYYSTMTRACKLCQPTNNTFLTSDCQCIQADGVEMAGILVINRMHPGPSIQVCLGDLVVVDVENKAAGTSLTIHFHGIYQNGYQYYDGVPYVTQCPISYTTTFRYKWRAQNSGTHFYHAHTGLHHPSGIHGAVIVRSTRDTDILAEHYDEDRTDNVIFLSDWFHLNPLSRWPGTQVRYMGRIPDNFLINGRGQWFNSTSNKTTDTPLTIIDVEPNRRYRFRMINSMSWTCWAEMTIQDHNMTLIATDGEPIVPHTVNTITSFAAERYDFVLHANQKVGSYWIQVRGRGACENSKVVQYAILRYSGSRLTEPEGKPLTYDQPLPSGVIFNAANEICETSREDKVCVQNLRNAGAVNERILQEEADITLYIPFGFHQHADEALFEPHTYKKFEVPAGKAGAFTAMLQNFSNISPPSPYLTQMQNIPPETICRGHKPPPICKGKNPCYCSHLIDIPLNSVVEIIMIDEDPGTIPHPFHLHGYGFFVMGQGSLESLGLSGASRRKVAELDRAGLLTRNFDSPPCKDTLATPTNGYTIVRFSADNPGYWLYHCHFQAHQLLGMELTFHVGEDYDLPPIPDEFPTCGDFKPEVWESD